ncbi:right-handed parallel beta-helix repeat-containing protein [Dyadobacter helix]|nr:right-handed parallel beta-helix repeat-containing protein [Dyadobacter sp. CECT 9275]
MKEKPLLLLLLCFGLWLSQDTFAGNSRIAAGKWEDREIVLYVSPKGSDSGEGTKKSPLKTLEGARQRVRKLRTVNRDRPVKVFVGGGVYALEKPVLFAAEDSGSENAPVVYEAEKNQQPVFSGSRKLKSWKVLQNKEMLKKLDPAVNGKVYVTDLREAGISEFGDATDLGLRPELFLSGQVQTLARWPNTGLTKAGKVMGKTALPATYVAKRGTKEGDFEYLDQRQDRWALESDVRLGGYWYWDWSEEFQKVSHIDTLEKGIHIREPYHGYGYKDSLRYFGLNLFCEIDTPGEWYLDRLTGLLYWYPPTGVNPSRAEVSLSVFSAPFMIEMQHCTNLSLRGLAFEEGRGSAIRIRQSNNCLISDCRVERFGKDGIHVEEGSGIGIAGCLLRTLGCGGMKVKGGDRKTLVPAGHFVEHTVVENFSLFKRTYQPAVYIEGCGMRLSHNRFRYSSSSAVRLEGNDIVLEYNQVSHVVNESDDQGGLDVFYNPGYRGNIVRYNHWAHIAGGTRHGAAGVRLDDMISGFTIYGNIFEQCGARDFGAVQIHGGKDNRVENNLFFKCPAGVSFSTWGTKRWLETLDSPVIQKKLYEEVDIRSELYQTRYPDLKGIRDNADVNTVVNNLLVDCEKVFFRDKAIQIQSNNTSVKSDGKELGTFCDSGYLKATGLQPIPYAEMGPKGNRWVID